MAQLFLIALGALNSLAFSTFMDKRVRIPPKLLIRLFTQVKVSPSAAVSPVQVQPSDSALPYADFCWTSPTCTLPETKIRVNFQVFWPLICSIVICWLCPKCHNKTVDNYVNMYMKGYLTPHTLRERTYSLCQHCTIPHLTFNTNTKGPYRFHPTHGIS